MPPDLTFLAETDFRNRYRPFGIHHTDRRSHMYLVGKTGTGKSTLLKNLMVQDIRNGHGVGVIDPHGDLVEDILNHIPPSRTGDVVYFNPADLEFPIGFNILGSVAPDLRPLVADHVIAVMRNIWADSWGPRLEYILSNAVRALLEVEGSTLLAVPRMLSDQPYRARIVAQVKDPFIKHFWIEEYEKYPSDFQKEAIAPIQNKIGQFLTSRPIRHIVGQVKNKMEFRFMMDNSRIFLANLSKGKMGDSATSLLGSLLVTKMFLAALRRVDQPEEARKDFYLYIDECQNLATPIFASILSEARKYRLNLVLSHQYLAQLSPDILQAVLGNIGTLISFRLGAEDALTLAPEFTPEVSAQDLENTGKHQIYIKLAVNGLTSRPFSGRTLPPIVPQENEDRRKIIIQASRQKYGTKREIIEDKILRWLTPSEEREKK